MQVVGIYFCGYGLVKTGSIPDRTGRDLIPPHPERLRPAHYLIQ